MKNRIIPKLSTNRLWQHFCALLVLLALFRTGSTAHAASQIWTNAPVDVNWTTTSNWVGKAVPGALNSSATTDTATFNAALTALVTNIVDNGDTTFTTNIALIGSAAAPILYDNTRSVRSMFFNTPACGAYVIGTNDGVNILYLGNAGFVVVSNDVVNPIIFGGTVRVKLPSSTNGRYDITNNAASPLATLTFSNIFNESANTRPMNFFLEGTNTGANLIQQIQDGGGADGAVLIDKVDNGRWILAGANDMPQKTSAGVVAHVFVSGGTLEVQDPGSLGSITVGNIVSLRTAFRRRRSSKLTGSRSTTTRYHPNRWYHRHERQWHAEWPYRG